MVSVPVRSIINNCQEIAVTKWKYFASSLVKKIQGQGQNCPSCGDFKSEVISRKYLVTSLNRCEHCKLLFRVPTTSSVENQEFYQEEYTQGATTDMPTPEQLKQYMATSFSGMDKDYSLFGSLLSWLGAKPGMRLLDYGCSWGYGSWQWQKMGYHVSAFEISRPRCEYARKHLGVDATSDMDTITGPFDVIFSSHVLEHVPSVQDSIGMLMKMLKPGGIFVAFTPNGSMQFRNAAQDSWSRLWGEVHPNFLDDEFYSSNFNGVSTVLASSPYTDVLGDPVANWTTSAKYDLRGSELMFALKKQG